MTQQWATTSKPTKVIKENHRNIQLSKRKKKKGRKREQGTDGKIKNITRR